LFQCNFALAHYFCTLLETRFGFVVVCFFCSCYTTSSNSDFVICFPIIVLQIFIFWFWCVCVCVCVCVVVALLVPELEEAGVARLLGLVISGMLFHKYRDAQASELHEKVSSLGRESPVGAHNGPSALFSGQLTSDRNFAEHSRLGFD